MENIDLVFIILTDFPEINRLRQIVIFWLLYLQARLNSKIDQVSKERDSLQSQMSQLHLKLLHAQNGHSSSELNSIIQEIQSQKQAADQECIDLRHKLVAANIESEKYNAILSVRNQQLNEIKKEMNLLQEVVNEHLLEIQKASYGSGDSSQSTGYTGMSFYCVP